MRIHFRGVTSSSAAFWREADLSRVALRGAFLDRARGAQAVETTTTAPTAPATEEEPKRELVVVDYAHEPKLDPTPTTPGPAATETAKPTNKSTVPNPTKAVWATADEIKAADSNVTARPSWTCASRKVAFYTTKTQVQRFVKAKKTTPTT